MRKILQLVFAVVLTTGLFAQETIYSEDFEAGMPDGWFAESGWQFGTSGGLSSQYFRIPQGTGQFYAANDDAAGNGGDASGRLQSEMIDLTSVDPSEIIVLSFDHYWINADYQGFDETANVFVSKDGGAFTEVLDLDGQGVATTNNLETWTKAQVVLEGYGGSTIRLAFDYGDGNGWNFGFAVDNVQLDVLTIAKDARLDAVVGWGFVDSAEGVVSSLEIGNDGYENINSLDIQISDAAGVVSTSTIEDVDISFGTSAIVALEFDYDISVSQEYEFDYLITNVNGSADEVTTNNAGEQTLVSVDTPPLRRWLVEELTAPGCTWCPRGAVFMDTMEEAYPDKFVGVAVHGDFGGTSPMMVDSYANSFFELNGEGYPTMSIERQIGGVGIPGLEDMLPFGEEIDETYSVRTAPVGVDVSGVVDSKDRILNITADVEWRANHSGNYSLLVIVTEDDVTGTSADYNQVNAYSGGNNGVMGGYENLPDPVPAADMSYNHVLRHTPTGYDGDNSLFAGTFEVGEVNTGTYAYTVPAEYDLSELNVVAVVINADTGDAVNSAINKDVELLTSADDYVLEGVNMTIQPNPAQDATYVNLNLVEQSDVQLTLRNTLGQVVTQRTYNNRVGSNSLPIRRNDLDQGTYFITITIDGKSTTQRVVFAN